MDPKSILKQTGCAVIATVGSTGEPWNTPVFFAAQEGTLYWSSSPRSVHSRNIAENGAVFIVVFDKNIGVYIQGQASVVNHEAEVRNALDLLGQKRGKPFGTITKFLPGGQQRIYKAVVEQAWINGAAKDDDGDFIADYRIAASL